MAKIVLIMRTVPAGAAVSGADVEFALVAGGGPFATDTTDVNGIASYEADGSPGPIIANADYLGAVKYFDGRSASQLGTWYTADVPVIARALGNGVIKGYTDVDITTAGDLAVTPGTGRKLAVAKGAFLLDGHVYRRTVGTQVDVTANASGSTRYDRIIFRFTREGQAAEGKFELRMLDGTSDSAGPSLTNSTSVQEFSLAKVAVVNGAASFVAGDITDERYSTTLNQGYTRTLPSGLLNGDILTVQSGVLSRLAKGTDGQTLTLASGLPAWATPTFSIVLQIGDTTVDANTTTLDFDSASFAGTSSPAGETNVSIKPLGISNAQLAGLIDAAKLSDGSISNTEFGYLNGVTSNIQTQLNALSGGVGGAGNVSATPTTTVDGTLVAMNGTSGTSIRQYTGTSTGVIKVTSGIIQNATASDMPTGISATKIGANTNVSDTEYGYLNGLTGNIQDQFDATIAVARLPTGIPATSIGATSTVSNTEYGYLANVTSDIQTQLDAKFAKAGGTITGATSITNSLTTSGTTSLGTATALVHTWGNLWFGGGTFTATAGVAAGTGGSLSATRLRGSENAGEVQVVCGASGTAGGNLVTVNFTNARADTDYIVLLTASSINAGGLNASVAARATGSFTIRANVAPSPGDNLIFGFLVVSVNP